jgi:hypothetical protein
MCILFKVVFTKLLGELVVQHYDPLLELIIHMLALLIM